MGLLQLVKNWIASARKAREEEANYHASWPSYEPSSTNIWATVRPSQRREFDRLLHDDESKFAAAWNEVFAREAEAQRRGESWNWDVYAGRPVEDILRMTERPK